MKKLNFGVDRLLFNSTTIQPVKTGLEPAKTSLLPVKTGLDQSINNRNEDNSRRDIDALIRLIMTKNVSGYI